MITLPPPNADFSKYPSINGFVDTSNGYVYLIETKADYALLPQSIKDMLISSPVTLADGSVSNQLAQLQA